ncbi:hypothetical protein RJ641_016451 [Dillenia turbinata]|uniref:Uncharacterized protein n=1 Tax=Dillenia turbinata TaxID=194707 RepID=A0AAN8YWT7_9MAGN
MSTRPSGVSSYSITLSSSFTTSIHVTVLDELVNINSLFTITNHYVALPLLPMLTLYGRENELDELDHRPYAYEGNNDFHQSQNNA